MQNTHFCHPLNSAAWGVRTTRPTLAMPLGVLLQP